MNNLTAFLSQNAIPVENIHHIASNRFIGEDGKPVKWEIKCITNLCQKFVRVCFEAAGIYGQAASANEACAKWKRSSDKNPPIGATVYFNGSAVGGVLYGHVGIYIGNGDVIHAAATVRINKLSSMSGYKGWGYQGGKAPTGTVTPSSSGSSGNTGGSSGNTGGTPTTESAAPPKKEYDPSEELGLLQTTLARMEAKTPAEPINMRFEPVTESPEYDVMVLINGDKPTATRIPIVSDLQITYERVGTPGKLSFKTLIEPDYPIAEGDRVSVRMDNKLLFVGYVFTRQRDKDELLTVTAYNQLRYLKNKDVMLYSNLSASEVIKAIAKDFNIVTGEIEDTAFKMSKIENNVTLFDIIQNALDDTLMATGEVYTLFDNCGELSLKNVKNMRVETSLIMKETAQNYDYKTSIDKDVYNKVKLIYENEETGSYDRYIAHDTANIEKWGVLQYMEKIPHPALGELKSQVILRQYNRLARTLTINGVLQ